MKAVVYTEYGPPDVLMVKDVKKPSPKDNEVLIRVHATAMNYGDIIARNFGNISSSQFNMPMPLLLVARMVIGWSKPRNGILGSELAGIVEQVGNKVKKFKKGDEVFAYTGQNMGANAEFICLKENSTVGLKPVGMSFEEAACVPYGGIMALDHLTKVTINKGTRVLVNGASGGIGSLGMQLARHYGAEVTGVCGTPRLDYVKTLGAEHVIDYKNEDFTKNGQTYDIIYDILGRSSLSDCKNSLSANGRYLCASFKTGKVLQMLGNPFRKKKIICAFASEKQEAMGELKTLVEKGAVKTVIDRVFPLEKAADAHRYAESGRKRGNVVITIAK